MNRFLAVAITDPLTLRSTIAHGPNRFVLAFGGNNLRARSEWGYHKECVAYRTETGGLPSHLFPRAEPDMPVDVRMVVEAEDRGRRCALCTAFVMSPKGDQV